MKNGATHTHFYRGKKVRAVLRDGTVIVGKFVERTRAHIIIDNCKILTRTLKSVGFAKERS